MALLLAVAAVGLYYYLWHYQDSSDLLTRQQKQRRTQPPKAEAQRGGEKKPKGEKQKQGGKQGGKQQKQGGKQQKKDDRKQQTSKEKVRKTQEAIDKALGEQEIQRLEKLQQRVLRQPITGADPDRPYLMDILTADNLLAEGKYQEALERFNALLSQFPQSSRAQLGKGLTLSHMAREKRSNKLMDTAIEFFRKAGMESIVAGDTIRVAALLALVDHAQERGKQQLAVRAMENLVELRSENVTYANQLGMLYLGQGNMWKAKAQFKKSVESFEDNHFGKAQLGYILYTERHYEEALPLLMEGIRADKTLRNSGFFYNAAGDTLSRLNRSEEVCCWTLD